ncbi:hypothetical protein GP486_002919, partial [Trichoglossum hirsutum]
MSAEALGRTLLGEVKEEGLDEVRDILHSLRILCGSRQRSQLHIPALDRLLNVFIQPFPIPRQPAAAAAEQVLHPSKQFNPTGASSYQAKVVPAVVEITSTSPYCGKTHLLYYITAIAVLPSKVNDVFLNGKEGAVVVLDTDARFDVLRLRQVMKHFIKTRHSEASALSEYDEDGLEGVIRHALLHVHIYHPQSSASLAATIEAIPPYLLCGTGKKHFSSGRALEAVLLDSVSAFVYQDRADSNNNNNSAGGPNHKPSGGNAFVKRYQDI